MALPKLGPAFNPRLKPTIPIDDLMDPTNRLGRPKPRKPLAPGGPHNPLQRYVLNPGGGIPGGGGGGYQPPWQDLIPEKPLIDIPEKPPFIPTPSIKPMHPNRRRGNQNPMWQFDWDPISF